MIPWAWRRDAREGGSKDVTGTACLDAPTGDAEDAAGIEDVGGNQGVGGGDGGEDHIHGVVWQHGPNGREREVGHARAEAFPKLRGVELDGGAVG